MGKSSVSEIRWSYFAGGRFLCTATDHDSRLKGSSVIGPFAGTIVVPGNLFNDRKSVPMSERIVFEVLWSKDSSQLLEFIMWIMMKSPFTRVDNCMKSGELPDLRQASIPLSMRLKKIQLKEEEISSISSGRKIW